jgi:hypothetical protein
VSCRLRQYFHNRSRLETSHLPWTCVTVIASSQSAITYLTTVSVQLPLLGRRRSRLISLLENTSPPPSTASQFTTKTLECLAQLSTSWVQRLSWCAKVDGLGCKLHISAVHVLTLHLDLRELDRVTRMEELDVREERRETPYRWELESVRALDRP